ncbi:hypothetical protein TNCV_3629271 [Trichonephila clavipes]|nr:hypothetical protein TNCV_3629271 [Trichonephila clavipes]
MSNMVTIASRKIDQENADIKLLKMVLKYYTADPFRRIKRRCQMPRYTANVGKPSSSRSNTRRRLRGSQWTKECPPGDKRRSCLTNESDALEDYERIDLNKGGVMDKCVEMLDEKSGAMRFQTGRECICVFRTNRPMEAEGCEETFVACQ